MLLSVVYHSPVVSLVSPGVTKLGKQALWNYKMIYWRYEFIVETRRCAVILFEVVILSHVSVVWFAVHRGCLITQRGWPSPTDCGRSCPAEAGVIPSELHWQSPLQANLSEVILQIVCPVDTPVPSSECHVNSNVFHQERFAERASADSSTEIDSNTHSEKS